MQRQFGAVKGCWRELRHHEALFGSCLLSGCLLLIFSLTACFFSAHLFLYFQCQRCIFPVLAMHPLGFCVLQTCWEQQRPSRALMASHEPEPDPTCSFSAGQPQTIPDKCPATKIQIMAPGIQAEAALPSQGDAC